MFMPKHKKMVVIDFQELKDFTHDQLFLFYQ